MLVPKPIRLNNRIITIGIGAVHSLTIGATIVTERAIIPHVPTDVFLLLAGNILSSVKEIYVVVIKFIMIPNFKIKINTGIDFASK